MTAAPTPLVRQATFADAAALAALRWAFHYEDYPAAREPLDQFS
jgi:hypothetical protein